MIKNIVFSDLDGTLLDHYTYEFIAAEKALLRLKTAGIPVILNTSKTLAELAIIQADLKLDCPFIIENGAAVYIPIGTFNQQPEDTEIVGDYWVKSFCLPVQHWLTLLSKENNAFSSNYQGFSEMTEAELSLLTGLNIDEADRAKKRQYGEPIQWLSDEDTKNDFIIYMRDLGANVVQGGRFIHIGGYCDKGQALLWLSRQYRLEYQLTASDFCTVALGDGENDVAMLEVADIAIQIKSPVHDFPILIRQKVTINTNQYGPKGWAEGIDLLLTEELIT